MLDNDNIKAGGEILRHTPIAIVLAVALGLDNYFDHQTRADFYDNLILVMDKHSAHNREVQAERIAELMRMIDGLEANRNAIEERQTSATIELADAIKDALVHRRLKPGP